MATINVARYLYDSTGNTKIYSEQNVSSGYTIQSVIDRCNNNVPWLWLTEVSATPWWEKLDNSTNFVTWVTVYEWPFWQGRYIYVYTETVGKNAYVWPNALKWLYVWGNTAQSLYLWTTKVRPMWDTRTFTITWTEQATMTSGWTYSDDAAWLTAWSSEFDTFFWYKPVLLNTSWVVTAELNPNDFTKDINWNSVNIISWDNVMIQFPIMWVKISKSGNNVTLSLTREKNKAWYQYYAHSRWTLSNPVAKDYMYIWAYEGFIYNNVLKSWSWRYPTGWGSYTMQNYIDICRANDGNSWNGWYDMTGFYQRSFIQALYMMKYWNPDSQNVVGKGWCTGNSLRASWQLNTSWMTSWNTSTINTPVKLFWIENFWGNWWEFIAWVNLGGSYYLYTALQGFMWQQTVSWNYENTGVVCNAGTQWYAMRAISGNQKAMFAATLSYNGDNYYWDRCDSYNGGNVLWVWWGSVWESSSSAWKIWLFAYHTGRTSSDKNSDNVCRLMYL